MTPQHHGSSPRAACRTVLLTTLLVACRTMMVQAQTFEWANYIHGPAWKHPNAVVVDAYGNSFVGGEFCDSVKAPGDQLTFGAPSFRTIPDDGEALEQGFIVVYDEKNEHRLVQEIKAGINSSVTVRSLALAGDRLYVVGTIQCSTSKRVNFGGTTPFTVQTTAATASYLARYKVIYAPPPGSGIVTGLQCEWVTTFEPTAPAPTINLVELTGVAVDDGNNPYVCGRIRGAARCTTHGVGSTISEDIAVPSTPTSTTPLPILLLIARCSPNPGSPGASPIEWSATNTGGDSTQANGIAALGTDDVVVTGFYSKAITLGTYPLASGGAGTKLFVANYKGSSSTWKWASSGTPGPSDSAVGNAIAVNALSKRTYVVGAFSGTTEVISQSAVTLISPSCMLIAPNRDFFITCYDSDGNITLIDMGSIGATGDAFGRGVATRGDSVYVTGSFSNTMRLGDITLGSMGNHDIFVAKYARKSSSATGPVDSLAWAQRAGNAWSADSEGIVSPHFNQGTAIAVAPKGGAIIIGEFGGDTLSPMRTATQLYPNPRNIFTMKLSATATMLKGIVFNDNSPKNGSYDPGEERGDQVVAGILSGDIEHYAMTSSNGGYRIYMPSLESLKAMEHNGWTAEVPPAEIFAMTRSKSNSDSGVRVHIIPQSTEYAVPGSIVRYLIRYQNVGTLTIPDSSATIELTPDSRLVYQSYTSTPTLGNPVVAGGHLIWQLKELVSLGQGQISVSFLNTAKDQESIASSVTMNFQSQSSSSIIQQVVVQPSDPNEKRVKPGGNISSTMLGRDGAALEYMIMFVNDGNASVKSVTIIDSLAPPRARVPDLNRIIEGSILPCLITKSVVDNKIVFRLTHNTGGTLLSPVHESIANSQGSLTIRVPLDPSLPVGTAIRNIAAVYFDNLDSVSTNDVVTCILPDFAVHTAPAGNITRFITREILPNSIPLDSVEYIWSDAAMIGLCRWDFGDGTSKSDSLKQDMIPHAYAASGPYEVTLHIIFTAPVSICGVPTSEYVVRKRIVIP